jgi:hypothetical protein
MATPIVGQQAEIATQPARELKIDIWPDDWAQYTGSAAQLQAEGLIPDGFEWPKAAVPKRWAAGGFNYWLQRSRPEGHKGPMRSWLEVDNWRLRVCVSGHDCRWRILRGLARKTEALRAEYHSHTAAGQREWRAAWDRYLQAEKDKRFQAFKALVPGLVPPKRGRKPKTGADHA